MNNPVAPKWRKSSRCESSHCVEVADLLDGGKLIRDSKNPGVVLAVNGPDWAVFVAGVKAGEFDA